MNINFDNEQGIQMSSRNHEESSNYNLDMICYPFDTNCVYQILGEVS
jgi:hypothetical protein